MNWTFYVVHHCRSLPIISMLCIILMNEYIRNDTVNI